MKENLFAALIGMTLSTTSFAQDGVFVKTSENELWKKKSCIKMSIVLEGTDPAEAGLAQKVELHRYYPQTKTPSEAHILIIPPTSPPRGKSTGLDKWYAEKLCSDGIGSIILDNWDGYTESDKDDFGTHDRATYRAVNAGKMALNYLNKPVFVMGTSVGAIYGSILLGSTPQIKGGVLIVGGAPLVEVLKTTDQTIPRKLREVRMKKLNIQTAEDYEKLLVENVHSGPENFIAPEKSKHMLMVIALEDTTVPTATQEKLWTLWGKPTRIDHNTDHRGTIVRSFLMERGKIRRFLRNEVKAADLDLKD